MPRIVIISIIILSALVLVGLKAKSAGYPMVSLALFSAAGAYGVISFAGFVGLIGG